MAKKMVGYGPLVEHSPSVPDFIVVSDGGRAEAVTRDGKTGPLTTGYLRCEPVDLEAGSWPLVYSEKGLRRSPPVEWFPLAQEAAWRAGKAQQLAREAQGDPELVIATIRAAAALVSVDLDKVVSEAKASARPGESLADAFRRR